MSSINEDFLFQLFIDFTLPVTNCFLEKNTAFEFLELIVEGIEDVALVGQIL
jgi:hypothetical protein